MALRFQASFLLVLVGLIGAGPFVGDCRAAQSPKVGHRYVIRCNILNERGETLKTFPAAKACIFLDDGSFIAATNDPIRLARIDAHGKILWTRGLHIHHQLKLSADGRKILTLGSDIHKEDIGLMRYDDFLILSVKTGETLQRWSGYDHREEWVNLDKHLPTQERPPGARENLDYVYEHTHFNSISEIPENPTAAAIPAFKKGNFLVGFNGLGFFAVLDSKLEKVLWTMRDPLPNGQTKGNVCAFHDLQMLPNGHLLVFNNQMSQVQKESFFAMREIDPVTANTIWRFPADEAVHVPTAGGGGLQYLPEGVLFNANVQMDGKVKGAAFLLDHDGKTLWALQERGEPGGLKYFLESTDVTRFKTEGNQFQDIKELDVSKFLRKNKI